LPEQVKCRQQEYERQCDQEVCGAVTQIVFLVRRFEGFWFEGFWFEGFWFEGFWLERITNQKPSNILTRNLQTF